MIVTKLDSLMVLIIENDVPPKIFDTIPLTRVTFNILITYFSSGAIACVYFLFVHYNAS